MPDILHVPDEVTTSRPLRTPDAVLDPATSAVVEAAVAEAEARGRREGEAAGRLAAAQAAEQAAATIRAGLDRLTEELLQQRALAATASLEMVATVAGAVLDRTPPDDALELLDRVRQAIEVLDSDRVLLRVSPTDHAALADRVHDDRLELVADASVEPGEALVGTSVAGATLTRRALLEAAMRAIGEEAAP